MMKKITVLFVLILIGGVLLAQEEVGEEPEEQFAGLTFWGRVHAGGWAMLFIGVCSVLALGITIERVRNMKPLKIVPEELVGEVNELVKQGRYDEARRRCEETPCPLSNVLRVVFEKRVEGKAMAVDAVEDAGARELAMLQQKITPLSVIAVISPMIGLLGTVLGMMQAFDVIAYQAGLGKPTLLAEGISKALVTTAFGLIVAIPTMVSYHSLRIKAENMMGTLEKICENFIGLIFSPVAESGSEEQAEKDLEGEGGEQ